MPAPEDKFAAVDELLFPVQNTGITTKYTLDQPTVEAALKARYIRDNPKLNQPKTVLGLFLAAIGNVATDLTNFWGQLVNGWNKFWDGAFGTSGSTGKTANDVNTAAAVISSTANTAEANAAAALGNVHDLAVAIYNAWYGSGGDGTPAQVAAVIAAIKDDINSLGGP